jgi:hypothetical protein
MSEFTPPNYSEIQRRMKNEGGSSYWGGYFKNGIYGGTPSKNKSFSGRILPMFDYMGTSRADPDFPKSWAPYRDKGNINQETGQPDLVAFFGVGLCYSWFGNKQVSFLSPHTYKYTHGHEKRNEMTDPLSDIHRYAKKHEDPKIRALTEREENKKDAKVILPYPQLRYFFNFYGTSGVDRTPKNYVIDFSSKGFNDLCGKLGEWRPNHERVVDQDWPDYLFGDITNPDTGILIDTVALPSSPQPFNGIIFTAGSHKSSKGVQVKPVPDEALIKRIHFYGDDMGFKIKSAQEIVDFLVEDGSVPYFLIEEVCSNYANVPPEPSRAKVFAGNTAEEDEEAAYVPRNPMVSKPAPAPQPVSRPVVAPAAPPAPPPPAAEQMYWISVNGKAAEKCNADRINKEMRDNPGPNAIKLCKVGERTWSSPEHLGFILPVEEAPPVPIDDEPPFMSDEAPSIEEAPPWGMPDVPVSSAPAVKKPSAEKAASSSSLTPEEQDELDRLELDFSRDGTNMGPEKLARIIYLRPKAGYASILP